MQINLLCRPEHSEAARIGPPSGNWNNAGHICVFIMFRRKEFNLRTVEWPRIAACCDSRMRMVRFLACEGISPPICILLSMELSTRVCVPASHASVQNNHSKCWLKEVRHRIYTLCRALRLSRLNRHVLLERPFSWLKDLQS